MLLVQYLNIRTGLGKANAGVVPGAMPEASFENSLYRTARAYLNAAETLTVFTTVVVMCILAGANPFWVNLLASVAMVTRVLMAVVHVRAIGQLNGGVRTMLFALGWLINIILAFLAIGAVFW